MWISPSNYITYYSKYRFSGKLCRHWRITSVVFCEFCKQHLDVLLTSLYLTSHFWQQKISWKLLSDSIKCQVAKGKHVKHTITIWVARKGFRWQIQDIFLGSNFGALFKSSIGSIMSALLRSAILAHIEVLLTRTFLAVRS